MPHFLIKNDEIFSDFIELKDSENFFHITKVLRAKVNEKIKFIDEKGLIYFAEITEINKNRLKAKILEKTESDRFLKTKISLIQSVLVGDSQALAIANATQTGVYKIYPVISDNVSVSKKSLEKKSEKWQKIALENFKQCERKDIPEVFEVDELKNVLLKFKKENILIFAEKYENCSLNNCLIDIDKTSELAIVIGPEGGFSQNEFDYFIKNNYKLITLGKMIYKAPNAIVAGVSNIISRVEDVL